MLRIAVAINTDNENTYEHFGHAERFKIYDTENNEIQKTSYLSVPEGHGVDKFNAMKENNVNIIISDGMGPKIVPMAEDAGMKIFAGYKGSADDAVAAFFDGTLRNDPAAVRPCGAHC